jgi:hypothetical protein
MRIGRTTAPPGRTGQIPHRSQAPGPAFLLPDTVAGAADEAGDATAAEAVPALPAAGISPPAPAGEADDRDAVAHAVTLLETLSDLQAATLIGQEAEMAQRLAALPDSVPRTNSPGLDAVLQAIAQRSAIERARRQ